MDIDIATCERCLDCHDCIHYEECDIPDHSDDEDY